jgi:hypothetical protein
MLRATGVVLVFGTVLGGTARAAGNVSVAVDVTVVPVCRFLTSASTVGAIGSEPGNAIGRARALATTGSATLTYACSNGTAAAFTFAVPMASNVACADCSEVPIALGTIQETTLGTGQGLGSGRDRTLTVRTPLVHASYENATFAGSWDTIIVTVSP